MELLKNDVVMVVGGWGTTKDICGEGLNMDKEAKEVMTVTDILTYGLSTFYAKENDHRWHMDDFEIVPFHEGDFVKWRSDLELEESKSWSKGIVSEMKELLKKPIEIRNCDWDNNYFTCKAGWSWDTRDFTLVKSNHGFTIAKVISIDNLMEEDDTDFTDLIMYLLKNNYSTTDAVPRSEIESFAKDRDDLLPLEDYEFIEFTKPESEPKFHLEADDITLGDATIFIHVVDKDGVRVHCGNILAISSDLAVERSSSVNPDLGFELVRSRVQVN